MRVGFKHLNLGNMRRDFNHKELRFDKVAEYMRRDLNHKE